MKIIFTTLKKTLFWSYERGSWQYDIMCVLILAFIFFAQNRFFYTRASVTADATSRALVVTSDELGALAPNQIEPAIAAHLLRKFGRQVDISRVDRLSDDSGKVIYLVTEK